MPQVSSLSENLALDSNDARAITRQKKKVDKDAKKMQEKIIECIQQNTEDYKKKVSGRMQEIDNSFEKFIPAIPVQEKAAIKQEIQESIQEARGLLSGKDSVDDFL